MSDAQKDPSLPAQYRTGDAPLHVLQPQRRAIQERETKCVRVL